MVMRIKYLIYIQKKMKMAENGLLSGYSLQNSGELINMTKAKMYTSNIKGKTRTTYSTNRMFL